MNTKPVYMIAFLIIMLAVASFYGDQSYLSLQEMRSQLQEEEQDNQALVAEAENLKGEVWNLKNDSHTVSEYARNKYGYAAPNEFVAFFDD